MKYHGNNTPRSGRREVSTSSALWRRIRARKLARQPLCSCGRLATCVDHRDNDSANNSSDNLESMCQSCHSRKTVAHDGGLQR